MTATELEKYYSIKQLQAYNSEIRSKYNQLKMQYNHLNNVFIDTNPSTISTTASFVLFSPESPLIVK